MKLFEDIHICLFLLHILKNSLAIQFQFDFLRQILIEFHFQITKLILINELNHHSATSQQRLRLAFKP